MKRINMETPNAVILVVDDQPANLKVLLSFLETHDFDVRIAENGERALSVLEKYKPDLILLDIMMPNMNGFETCSAIKANAATADIPIIFMTALNNLEDKIEGFEAGGVDYIVKPFQQAEVLARINTHITLRKQQKELEESLAEVKRLEGILPICSFCKKIRDDDGYWQQVEQYISDHSQALFSHGLCSECMNEHYGDMLNDPKD